jgi:uncharacterized protein (DUF1015 family)
MAILHPFKGCLPAGLSANEFIAPPYDVVTELDVRKRVRHRPYDFLHVTRGDALTELDLAREYSLAHWQKWIRDESVKQDATACYYVYRLENDQHQQTGILACIDLQDYINGDLKRHELTRPDKEMDRAQHIEAFSGQLSPVLVCYQPDEAIHDLLTKITNTAETESAELDEFVHRIWRVDQSEIISQLSALFKKHALYIADGHHRCAAAKRAAEALAQNPNAHSIFAGIFPSNELTILGYHRVIRDLEHFNLSEFLGALQDLGELIALEKLSLPNEKNQIHIAVGHEYYSLKINPKTLANTLPDALDCAWLSRHVLEPIVGIMDIRRDPRIDFVGGNQSLIKVQHLIDEAEVQLAFLLYPTSVEELMQVADQNALMPPKSTWFEPKLADGLVSFIF